MKKTVIELKVNGGTRQVACRPNDVLLDVLREDLNLTGTKRGCDMGTCGCCTVLADGVPVLSCLALAAEYEGKEIRTIEGLRTGDQLHPMQRAFAECGGSQCGFCTPGFVMTSVSLIERNPDPTLDEVKDAISGNQCRCTGYVKIFDAVLQGARKCRESHSGESA